MNKKTDERIEELHKQIDEWKDKYLRALADYQNLERRNGEEWQTREIRAAERIISKFLPVADTFGKAAGHLQDKGLDLAMKSFADVLAELGVEKLEVVGQLFDPKVMECVEVVEGEEGIVVEEVLPGYRLRDKVIRVAKVKVGKMKGE